MAEISEMIDKVVSDVALASLDSLEEKIVASYLEMEELLKKTQLLNVALSKSGQSFSELSKSVEQVVQVEQKSTQVIQRQNTLIQQKADLTNKIIANVKNLSKAESDFYESEGLAGETMKKINSLLVSTNGLREDNVNREVKSKDNSQHIRGQAADISVGGKAANKALFDLIRGSGIAFDQLIDEYDYRWVHVSYRESGNRG